MKLLKSEQLLPISIEQAWDFFSSPKNLNEITPEDMVFKITSEVPEKMYEGLFITYKIAPVLNIPLDWVTEITHVKEPFYFVDEQRKGPYKTWHHEHHFKQTPEGVLMTDILYYEVGKSIFGWLAEKLFVDNKVKGIFSYREKVLNKKFGFPKV
jgi:ligand-binding SRPBCC domain-containing protein